MSRFRQALAATAMAAAAAGGGLLIAAAGAVPAYAATQVSPPGGHSGGHVVATFTFKPAAQAAGGPGASVIHPCVRPGAAPAYGDGGGGGCGVAAPSVSGQPAGRHPDLIACGG